MSRTLSKMLAQYDSEVGLVCDRKNCTRPATHSVTWHVLDGCGGLPTGVRAFVFCAACAKDTVRLYREKFDKMKAAVAKAKSGSVQCTTCGKRMTKLADACRMERLK